MQLTRRNGLLVSARVVLPKQDLMVISKSGDILRTTVDSVARIGRSTQGVIIKRVETDDPIVAVTGCVAQQEGDKLIARSAGVVDVVVGTQRIKMLPMLATKAIESRQPADIGRPMRVERALIAIENPYEEPSFPLGVVRREDHVRAYVTIIEGCNDFCSFCVVPYTRGHERMRAKAEILADVREAAASGRREVQLLGQIVNHYQAPDDPACDFPALLEAVHDIPGIDRIRFASPHPRHTR